MRLAICSLSALLCCTSAQADVFDVFEELQPVSTWVSSNNSSLNLDSCCDDSECGNSGCTSAGCGCRTAPAPTMIGGSSLSVPFSAADVFEVHYFTNFYTRVAENNSAIPQNRVFFNYKFLNDVPTAKDIGANARDYDSDFSHYELGLEKTLFNGNVSVELLVPFSYGPESFNPRLVGVQGSDVELQNIAFGLKTLLLANDSKAISAGVRVEAPTKEDIMTASGFTVPNEVWAVTPYLATLINLNDDLFFQAFASYRLQTDDYTTSSPDLPFREPNNFDLDAQLGYWLYRNSGASGLNGLQAKTEIHYTGTFEPYQFSTNFADTPENRGETNQLNLTTGLTAIMNDRTTITAGIVLPIREGASFNQAGLVRPHPSDRFFDWQANLQVNYYFGNQ